MDGLRAFVASFLLHPSNDNHTPRETDPKTQPFATKKIRKPVILTCSHGSRDHRCGILGPAIIKAFAEALEKQDSEHKVEAILGEISHIGGHKYAGNVIIHLPGYYELAKTINKAPIASSIFSFWDSKVPEETASMSVRSVAIWYGRVLPGHVGIYSS
ncbi:hypothetical protein ABW21_db0201931 [Orbilia brochopaga]|nr:hypothetical protein ABW21_db0201931 [Drechslerella brochopaga]